MAQFLAAATDSSLFQSVQTSSGAYPTFCSVGTGVSFPGVKWLGSKADLSTPSSAEVKNEWRYTFTPPLAFMACTGMRQLYVLYKRQYFVFLSYVMVGRLCGTGTLIVLCLCPVAAHCLQKSSIS
jgi:hypothetical protein